MSQKNIYLYLDDKRKLTESNMLLLGMTPFECKTYKEAIETIETKCYKDWTSLAIDLDHDLGSKRTGYDFCKWLISQGWKGKFHCHTSNPVGRDNMRQLLLHYGWEEF